MKRVNYFLLLSLLLFTWTNTLLAQQEKTLLNKIHVKVHDGLAFSLNSSGKQSLLTGLASFDQLNQQWSVKNIKRVFPNAGKFEAAHRAYGLHQWYEVSFDDSADHDINQLIQIYQKNEAVIIAEAVYEMSLNVMPQQEAVAIDPQFEDQWHYENTGQTGGTQRADIKLSNAWKLETGSKEVVVAIIDGGIDPTHEDLKNAMWINQAEADGKEDVDDDHNGYVDDIYGYGFGDGRGDFYPHYHGIHVGGTVGAVSMNGTGVAGVAGGSGTGDGVRLMSCAVFGSHRQGGFPEAFVYAADNGAVIAQNSWEGGAQSDVLEDAIDYFIARAGYDNTKENFDKNIQIGPMAGGIVIFAAGNNSSPHKAYPGGYEPCIAVASTDHNDQKSHFSNYGDWVDIAAPGSNILSTYTESSYNYLSGTSMACPHVAGTAALIVSRFRQKGLKPDQVKSLLLGSADNIDDVNTDYEGQLGAGRLNAFKALNFDNGEKAPAAITDLKVDSVTHQRAFLSWTATGNDDHEGAAAAYHLRYSTAPITNNNFAEATPINDIPTPKLAGEMERLEVRGLPSNTKLYFAIKALDYHQLSSNLSNIAQGHTKASPVMKISPKFFSVNLNSGDSLTKQLTIDNTQGKSPLAFSLAIQESADSNKNTYSMVNRKVLLIRSYKNYNKDAEDLLRESFNITPDIIGHYAISDCNFSNYDLIIIASMQGSSFYDKISAQKARFESFISRGGVVLYQAHGYTITLPGDATTNYSYSYTDLKVLDHYITKNVPDQISESYSSYYYLQQLPANSSIVTVTQSDALPSTAVYEYGAGEVIATTMPWEYFYYAQHEAGDFLYNAVYYALNESSPRQWVKPDQKAGTVAAGSSVKLNMYFNAESMFSGIHQKNIMITSNDPKNEQDTVTVMMEVTGTPVIQVAVQEMDFGNLYTKQSKTDTLIISNNGTDTLKISSITAGSTAYTTDTAGLQLAPFEEQKVAITFAPLAAGVQNSKLTINSNDKKNAALEVSLKGTALLPPIAEVTPASITLTVKRGQKKTSTLTISNEKGDNGLNWQVKMNYKQYEAAPYHQWLSFSDKEGNIDAAASQEITLTTNADNLLPGSYSGLLTIHSNDPVTPQLNVTVNLTVIRDDDPAESQPPVLTDSLKDQELILQEATQDINLAQFFKDPEDYPLSFTVSSRNTNIASTSVVGSQLSIATKDSGETVLDLLAEDIDGFTLNYSFKVKVTQPNNTENANLPPVTTLSQQQYHIALGKQLSLHLDTLFSDPDGDALIFQSTVSDTTAAKAEVSAEHILQVQPLAKGNFTVSIIASDSLGESIKATLSIAAFTEALALSDSLQNISLMVGDSSAIQLEKLIANERTVDITYRATIIDSTVLTTTIKDAVLSIHAQKAGTTDVTVSITSKWGDSVSTTFTVKVEREVSGIENAEFSPYDLTSYPNPLGATTVIAYRLTQTTHVTLQVYTPDGTLLATLINEEQAAGAKHLHWNTMHLSAGIYIIRLITTQGLETIKVVK